MILSIMALLNVHFCRRGLECNTSGSDYAARLTEYRAELVRLFLFQNLRQ